VEVAPPRALTSLSLTFPIQIFQATEMDLQYITQVPVPAMNTGLSSSAVSEHATTTGGTEGTTTTSATQITATTQENHHQEQNNLLGMLLNCLLDDLISFFLA
jgi:hypothetical protein